MAAIVFSPHLDDAVFSASTRLMRDDAKVITVFAGSPHERPASSWWERLTRAPSSLERHHERLAEDRAALMCLGRPTEHLDEPEAEYREGELDLPALAVRLRPFLEEETTEIWIPAAIGGHPDHLATRDAVLSAVRSLGSHREVFLYADLPYTMRFGWPTWVTREAAPEFLDPDFWLEDEMRKRGLDPKKLTPQITKLTAEMRERKALAARSYRTQLAALGLGPHDENNWTRFLSYELAWRRTLDEPVVCTAAKGGG